MADKIIPDDLRNTTSDKKTNDYFLVTVNDLNPAENYSFQFRWAYEDKTASEWSSTFSTYTVAEGTPFSPKFVSGNLEGGNGFVKLTWTGLNALNNPMTGIKQVNIWIKGGTYGSEFVNSGQFFTAPGTKTITLPIGEYFFKIQAETALGSLSLFSDVQSARSFKSPTSISSLSGTWLKDDGITKTDTLKVLFTYDSTFSDSTNSNLDTNHFIIKLTNSGRSRSFILAVNKTSSSQAFYLSRELNIATFGLFAGGFTMSVTAVDSFGNLSDVTTATSSDYVTPLDTPVITLTAGILSYFVSWNSQSGKPLDQIYIEEVQSSSSSAPSTGWEQKAQGTQNPLTVETTNSNKRWVRARFYDSTGNATTYGTAQHVTPYAANTANTEGPPDVASVTSSGGLDASGIIGFNGFANISWNSVTTGGIRGYRIRYKPTTSSSYSYADSPGSGTSYRLTGLAAGLTYQIAVATYDAFNNTSSNYVSGSNVTVGGTPYIASTVDVTGYFSAKANAADAESTAFKFGYGIGDTGLVKRGIKLNDYNYWYLDSAQSASIRVGGPTTNYIEWNGTAFVIDGDLRAKKGSFSGNINMATGASIYSGTIGGNSRTVTATGDTGGELVSAGYLLNSGGITFSNGLADNLRRETNIVAATGKFTTDTAIIGNWNVDKTTISNNGIVLTAPFLSSSKPSIIINKGAYYLGLQTPNPSNPSGTDIVLWAGQSEDGGSVASGANFRVTAGGNLYATGAVISGALVIESGSTFDEIALAKLAADNAATLAGDALPKDDFSAAEVIKKVNSTKGSSVSTYIIGGAIATGTLISTGYSGPEIVGSDFSTNGTAIRLDQGGGISAPGFYITPGDNASANFRGNIKASNIDAESRITGAEIVGAVFKTSATVNKTDRPANGVYIDSTGIYGYGTNNGIGQELFKLTEGLLTTKSALIGPLTVLNGAITSTQFSIDVNGNAIFKGAVEGGTLQTAKTTGNDYVFIKENDIKFYSGNNAIGAINVTNNSISFSGSPSGTNSNGGRFTFAADGTSFIQSGNWGRIDFVQASTVITSPTQASNNITIENDKVLVKTSAGNERKLRNIAFTTNNNQPSTGDPGDIVLVYSV